MTPPLPQHSDTPAVPRIDIHAVNTASGKAVLKVFSFPYEPDWDQRDTWPLPDGWLQASPPILVSSESTSVGIVDRRPWARP